MNTIKLFSDALILRRFKSKWIIVLSGIVLLGVMWQASIMLGYNWGNPPAAYMGVKFAVKPLLVFFLLAINWRHMQTATFANASRTGWDIINIASTWVNAIFLLLAFNIIIFLVKELSVFWVMFIPQEYLHLFKNEHPLAFPLVAAPAVALVTWACAVNAIMLSSVYFNNRQAKVTT
ncbi:MAG: hypothetical protein FWF23_00810 [Alphaproteobacteria bacterium]|nr:hypothetical protein [Alphaproteobacteria bacterium]MCL2505747.1 hypothetical protein [Alphaproteobacteria bacterium]